MGIAGGVMKATLVAIISYVLGAIGIQGSVPWLAGGLALYLCIAKGPVVAVLLIQDDSAQFRPTTNTFVVGAPIASAIVATTALGVWTWIVIGIIDDFVALRFRDCLQWFALVLAMTSPR